MYVVKFIILKCKQIKLKLLGETSMKKTNEVVNVDELAEIRQFLTTTIKNVKPETLSPHEDNSKIYNMENSEYFAKLSLSVKQMGIMTPIIATIDSVILAGHGRQIVARELDLKTIPVLFCKRELTKQEERLIMLHDNVVRRQLTRKDRIEIYLRCDKLFHEKVKIVPGTKRPDGDISLDPKRLSKLAGIPPSTIAKDMQDIRKELDKQNDVIDTTAISIKVTKRLAQQFRRMYVDAVDCNEATRKDIVRKLTETAAKIKKLG